MLKILSRRIKDSTTFNLLKEIIYSYTTVSGKKVGMPIGNLTSQIFANIYMNELDRFVKHVLKPKAYLRYGDDFILIDGDLEKLKHFRNEATQFLEIWLRLKVNSKCDRMMKTTEGLKFLGVWIWPTGRTLIKRSLSRTKAKLTLQNLSSYSGLIKKHCNLKQVKQFNCLVCEKIFPELFKL